MYGAPSVRTRRRKSKTCASAYNCTRSRFFFCVFLFFPTPGRHWTRVGVSACDVWWSWIIEDALTNEKVNEVTSLWAPFDFRSTKSLTHGRPRNKPKSRRSVETKRKCLKCAFGLEKASSWQSSMVPLACRAQAKNNQKKEKKYIYLFSRHLVPCWRVNDVGRKEEGDWKIWTRVLTGRKKNEIIVKKKKSSSGGKKCIKSENLP